MKEDWISYLLVNVCWVFSADTMYAMTCLDLLLWIPMWLDQNEVIGAIYVESMATCHHGKQQNLEYKRTSMELVYNFVPTVLQNNQELPVEKKDLH